MCCCRRLPAGEVQRSDEGAIDEERTAQGSQEEPQDSNGNNDRDDDGESPLVMVVIVMMVMVVIVMMVMVVIAMTMEVVVMVMMFFSRQMTWCSSRTLQTTVTQTTQLALSVRIMIPIDEI